MVKRIVICGIPKSGTKLMNHMIHTALPDWDYDPEERNYVKYKTAEHYIIKKPFILLRFQRVWNDPEAAGIIMVRDPLLVLTSKHRTDDYWVFGDRIGPKQPAPIRWYQEILKWREKGACVIHYEDVVADPNQVQKHIGQEFGIQWKASFSRYIETPMPEGFEYLNVRRPLVSRQLRVQDLPHLGTELQKSPELIQIRRKLGYERISML
jgi:hypothetical protein